MWRARQVKGRMGPWCLPDLGVMEEGKKGGGKRRGMRERGTRVVSNACMAPGTEGTNLKVDGWYIGS